MSFCPKCEGLLYPRNKNGKKYLVCRNCGYQRSAKGTPDEEKSIYKHTQTIEHHPSERIAAKVLDKAYYDALVPESALKNFRCPRCGFDRATLQTRQTRSADEGMTHFIICLKCGKMIKIGS
ncbi:MAG: RPA12/RPB9/RPC11 RNA polymerase family protein [Promethearchaeota archaeon]